MAISKLINPTVSTNRNITEAGCQLGVSDCMFLDNNGNCSAEWCIFSQLPKVINTTRQITCSICGESVKNVSIYSGIKDFICPVCKQKIREKIYEQQQ